MVYCMENCLVLKYQSGINKKLIFSYVWSFKNSHEMHFFIHPLSAFLACFSLFSPFFALQLGNCVAKDANPPANITWFKNNKPLEADGKGERSPSLLLSLSSKKIYLTFINIAYTDGFILSDRDSCCKLFCCDELCCTLMTARLMTVCSVLVIAHFFPC